MVTSYCLWLLWLPVTACGNYGYQLLLPVATWLPVTTCGNYGYQLLSVANMVTSNYLWQLRLPVTICGHYGYQLLHVVTMVTSYYLW